MPHAGDYLVASEVGKEYYYPLRIHFCKKCGLVQNLDVISPTTLFKKYYYLSSVSLSEHFQRYAEEMKKRFLDKYSFVVEIGSNDGVLLSPLKKMSIKALGVDPASNIAKIAEKKGVKTIVGYFGVEVAEKILKQNGKADAILANNVLAHIDDMNDVFKGIVKLLEPKGVLIFEVHYLPDLLKKMQYDFFYSEHLSYYSLSSLVPFLSKYNLEIFDVRRIQIHSGSIRVYAQFKKSGDNKVCKSVRDLHEQELKFKRLTERYLKVFCTKVYKHKEDIKKLLINIKKNRQKIAGYGAGGRANTLLNFCGIDKDILDYVVDDSPERQGKFTPGTHIPIVSPDVFRKDNIKYCLLLAWNYKEIIMKKEKGYLNRGGKFIIPLPKIKIIYEK
jgi:SAM-dependent methyltransferase